MSAYAALKYVHVLAALVVIGVLAVLLAVQRRPPPEVARPAALATVERLVDAVVGPALLVLFATGVVLVAAPVEPPRDVDLTGLWVYAGMGAWALLAAASAGYVSAVARVRGDAAEASAAWRGLGPGLLAALALAVGAVGLMVYKPG